VLTERPTHRGRLKARLIAEGLKQDRCEECGLRSWRGLPVTLQLHHANGCAGDHRLENLRLLCPNCHSQTPTHSRKGAGRRR
jgi:5-methylcytosine-specific restriction endonuclease McrA